VKNQPRPKVLLLHQILEPGLTVLNEEVDVVAYPDDQPVEPKLIAQAAQGCLGILSLLKDPITEEVLSVPGLKVVANCAVGFENIDVAAATKHGVMVTNTPGVLDQSTADFAFALMMATARRVVEADQFVRDGHFEGWGIDLMLGRDLYGATLGIVGMGRIGQAVARRSSGFLMRLLYHNRHPVHRDVERALHAQAVDLDTLLVESDIVSIHVPLTSETRHLIGAREIALMKPTAILINTSRGAVVDEAALIDALKNHRLFGAGLDVFEREPEVPAALSALPNVVLAPHIGSASAVTRAEMSEIAARNLLIGIRGATPANLVNPEVLA
jgi:glyoxylate reductase